MIKDSFFNKIFYICNGERLNFVMEFIFRIKKYNFNLQLKDNYYNLQSVGSKYMLTREIELIL